MAPGCDLVPCIHHTLLGVYSSKYAGSESRLSGLLGEDVKPGGPGLNRLLPSPGPRQPLLWKTPQGVTKTKTNKNKTKQQINLDWTKLVCVAYVMQWCRVIATRSSILGMRLWPPERPLGARTRPTLTSLSECFSVALVIGYRYRGIGLASSPAVHATRLLCKQIGYKLGPAGICSYSSPFAPT